MSLLGEDLDDLSDIDHAEMDHIGDPIDEPDRYEIFMPAVQSLINALGGYEEHETSPGVFESIYRPGDSVLAVLKDLKKLWRKDDSDDERTVARCMAKGGLMKELIALLVECTDRGDWGRKVALVACDLIAALTWPIDVMQELKEMEDEPDIVTDYVSLLRAQVEYKAMLLQTNGPLRCILALILPSLARPRKDERDEKVISLGLHIVRNLLAIRDAVAEGTATGEKEEFANLQSTLIVQMDNLTYFQLLLTLASCADKTEFNQYNVLVLDILHLVFRSVRVSELGQDQARAPMENLNKLLEAEKRQKSMNSRAGMTRHSRFGTTVAVRAGEQKLVLHKQNAISVNAGKILDQVKRKRAGRMKKVDELGRPINLSPDAMRILQTFSKSFVQSCFNIFFRSIMRDIRMERSKIRPTDNLRCFFLARFFVEYFLLLRAKVAAKNDGKVSEENDLALGLVGEIAEMESVRWVVMRMKYTMDDKPPAWKELQASIDCFTQILLLIDAMATSEDEIDLEAAAVLQEQLYYNGDILDSCLLVISQYKDQSVGYLDSVVHFAYVLLRMLEKYSKNKSYMFVRKRRAAKSKRKADDAREGSTAIHEDYNDEDEEAALLEADKDMPSYAEHAFTFQSFEKRFASEAVVNTLVSYLARYRDFDENEQMKRVVGLIHRQVVKTQAEGLYFRVSCLALFRHIMDDQHTLPKTDSTKDLLQLINFVLRKFFKRVAEDPFLIVQALGPKSRGNWKELSSYKSDEEEDDGMGGQKARIQEKMLRAPAELEFKKNKNLSWSDQMGTVIAMLLQAEHRDWIEWVIEVIELVLAARTEIVLSTDGPDGAMDDSDTEDYGRVRNFSGPSKAAQEKFEQYDVDGGTEERKTALAKDAHLRLMLKLLSFERTDEDIATEQRWFIPPSVPPPNLSTSLGALRQYLLSPPDISDPKSLLRKARPPRPARKRQYSFDFSDEELNQPKIQRKKKTAETQFYKSAAFIDDSDDDEEADKAFFAREKTLREEMMAFAEKNGGTMLGQGMKRKRGEKKGKARGNDSEKELGYGKRRGRASALSKEQDVEMAGSDSGAEPIGVESEAEEEVESSEEETLSPVRRKGASFANSDNETGPSSKATTQQQRSKHVIASDTEDE